MTSKIQDLRIALDIARANLERCKDISQMQKLVNAVADTTCDLAEAIEAARN